MDLRTTIVIAVVLAAVLPAASGVAAAQDEVTCSFPTSEVDATGTEVTVEEDPERIVTLGPSAAQTMWEIGAEDEVVGVSKFSTYLEGATEKENVSGAGQEHVVAEKVVALEPDLVLAPNIIDEDTVEQLRDAGLVVFRFEEATSVDDVSEKTLLTGRLVGECEGAAETVDWMEGRIDAVREAVEDEERPRVVYPLGGGVVVGADTFVDDLVATAGGQNIAATVNESGYPQLSGEVIVEQDPEFLILNEGFEVGFLEQDAYDETTALREDQIVYVDANYANQPAPQIVYPIETMAAAFHPDAFSPPDDATATQGTTASTTETDGQPGFGIVAVAFALVAVLLASRTR